MIVKRPPKASKTNLGSRTYLQFSQFFEGTFVESVPPRFAGDTAPLSVFVPVEDSVSTVYCNLFFNVKSCQCGCLTG